MIIRYISKIHFLVWWLVFACIILGCSVDVNQPPAAVSPIASTQNPNGTWRNLTLTGKLLYNAADNTTSRVSVQSLDLKTGDIVTIFQVPQRGWVDAVTVSPDRQTLILSYSPPMEAPYGGQGSIYRMPLDGSKPPQLLVTPATGEDQYSQPTWSPDGKYIYFAHINYGTMNAYEILRMAYPDGKPEKLMDHAYWPRVSDDNTLLVYVALEPQSGKNKLSFASADGKNPHQVPLNDLPVPDIIDTPMFSPDNQSIIFSSPLGIKASTPHWFDKLLGVQMAYANGGLPSDWWSVPISGGTPTQLTNIQSFSLFGTFSPDKKYIASYSLSGIFVMKPDGTELTIVVNDVGGIPGTVNWIP